MIAIPSEPPTWRMLFSTAEPTPAWSRGTELIAAAVVGVIVSAMPTPAEERPGRIAQKVEPVSSREKMEQRDGEQEHPAADQPARAEAVG